MYKFSPQILTYLRNDPRDHHKAKFHWKPDDWFPSLIEGLKMISSISTERLWEWLIIEDNQIKQAPQSLNITHLLKIGGTQHAVMLEILCACNRLLTFINIAKKQWSEMINNCDSLMSNAIISLLTACSKTTSASFSETFPLMDRQVSQITVLARSDGS